MKRLATNVFRVFVSSTFSDLGAERDALQRRVWPALDRFCRDRGARFQAVDLRWGVRDEAALDQKTMTICLEELRRCQHTTPRPNFLILLGDRYGWRPLPPTVLANEFEELLAVARDPDRLRTWYMRDANAAPHEYVLLPRRSPFLDPSLWAKEERKLLQELRSAIDHLG